MLAAAAACVLFVPALVLSEPRIAAGAKTSDDAQRYQRVMVKEATSRVDCETDNARVFVKHRLGTECIAYFVTAGNERQPRAVIFLDGDIPLDKMADEARILAKQRQALQRVADRSGVRLIAISRPGVLGSSGDHGKRRQPAEALSVNAALDILKVRLSLDQLVLAGQSGGSTIVASLLTLGRVDISCAILGSGNFEVVDQYVARAEIAGRNVQKEAVEKAFYDPSRHIAGVKANGLRRLFVLGDPSDVRTPFPQQKRFAEALKARGHHVELISVDATGPDSHWTAHLTLPAAAMCARGLPDERIHHAAQSGGSAPAPRSIVIMPSIDAGVAVEK